MKFSSLSIGLRHKEWVYCILAVFLPLLVQLIWLLHNTQLPVADADEQLSSSYHLYKHFASHHFIEFITNLYYIRANQWRPTGFYILQVPFQIISGGDLMFTTRAITLACTLASCIYIYLLLRLMLEPAQAILGTAILGLLPCTEWPGTMLAFNESAFLPAILAALYHLIRSDTLQDGRHRIYFVAATIAAFAVRPVETVNHLAPLSALFLFLSWRSRHITSAQCYRIVLGAFIAASILIISALVNYKIVSYSPVFDDHTQGEFFYRIAVAVISATLLLSVSGIARTAWTYWKAGRLRLSPIESAFTSLYVLIVLFYLPFVAKLVEWIYTCSFGSLAILSQRPSTVNILRAFIKNTGIVPFIMIITMGLVSFIFLLTTEVKKKILYNKVIYYSLSIIPVTLIVTLLSVQFVQRKVTVIIDLLLLIFLIPALMRGYLWYLRNSVMVLLATLQLYCAMQVAEAHPLSKWMDKFRGKDQSYPNLITTSPNPNITVVNFLESVAKNNHYKLILLPISTAPTVDPFLVSMLVENQENEFHVRFPYISTYDSKSVHTFLSSDQDAFMLFSDTHGEMLQSPEEAIHLRVLKDAAIYPNEKLRYELQALYAENKFPALGINKTKCLIIMPINRETCIFGMKKK